MCVKTYAFGTEIHKSNDLVNGRTFQNSSPTKITKGRQKDINNHISKTHQNKKN
jgi:hypothetical protein